MFPKRRGLFPDSLEPDYMAEDAIILRLLRRGDSLSLSGWTLNAITHISIREMQREF